MIYHCVRGHEYYFTRDCGECRREDNLAEKAYIRNALLTKYLLDIQEQKEFLKRFAKNWNQDYDYLV